MHQHFVDKLRHDLRSKGINVCVFIYNSNESVSIKLFAVCDFDFFRYCRQLIHNHLIICGVNFENGLSFGTEHDRKNNPAWKQLRKISDDICIENKLSVIEMPEKGYGKCYYEWLQDMKKNSYKSKLKNAIDSCVMTSDSFDDFLNRMQNEMNYEYKIRGHSLSFRAEEQERFTRCSRKSLGLYIFHVSR